MKNKCDYLFIVIIVVNTKMTLTRDATVTDIAIAARLNPNCTETEKPVSVLQNPADGICPSMHIRNYLDQFVKLENCTVIEGFLHISLIEATPEDFVKWSFPMLREITAYLTLYRVNGLKSLGLLFPNLAVIRGRKLLNNYALVAYEMTDLEELGLMSLRAISRGGVRITKSKKMCYVDTVDWGRLGVDPGSQDFKDNKEESQCANYCREECPMTKVGNVNRTRCWTSQYCQQGLNCDCRGNQTCMANGTCCHDYCLGGCSGPGPGDCYSCKDVSYNGSCLQECPPYTYKYADRRCLTDKECFAVVNNTADIALNTKILMSNKSELRVCVPQCPQNYTVREHGELKNLLCVECLGFCPKVCNGTDINSIEDAQKLKDCNKIVGNLVILQIMGGSNVAYEMEKNLGNIKEVTGFISVQRSYALLTLYFLKSLEVIGGENLSDNKHSFTLMDNSQLQDLFPEEQMRKMKLKNGLTSFHSNRKLCKSKIKTFVRYLNLTESEQDIGENGNLIPCVEKELGLNVTTIYHNSVLLNWEKDTADERHLLAYIINYKEIKSRDEDINIYEGRDVCSADTWMTTEVLPSEDTHSFQTYDLKDLKAFTEYAVYVQTYTLSSATHFAMTNITFFKTNPYYPSEPFDLEVTSFEPHELYVTWKPPKFPNGVVTHYKVLYQIQELDITSFEQRDYCQEPITAASETPKSEEEETEKEYNVTAACCPCERPKEEREAEARKREIEIYFENYLHDQVYCERYDTLPTGVSLSTLGLNVTLRSYFSKTNNISLGDELYFSSTPPADNGTHGSVVQNYSWTGVFQEAIVKDTNIYLPNLEHFQEYSIEVQACHDTNPDKPISSKLCSNRALAVGRTKASWIKDRINESSIDVQIVRNTTIDAIITWESPPKPNGLFLTYYIFYKRASQDNLVPTQVCVNIREFKKISGYRLTGLDAGNWTFQINAVSLAGNSTLTSEKYFIIPHYSDDEDTSKTVIIITTLAILVLVASITSAVVYAKYKKRMDKLTVIASNPNYMSSEPTYVVDDWEVDRDNVTLLKELGKGSFGMVYEGEAQGLKQFPGQKLQVAIKTANKSDSFSEKQAFLNEAVTMKTLDCNHIVRLLGVVSIGQPALVIMELMALGDLKTYLRRHRPDEEERPGVTAPRLLDILQMAGEIADGMIYLSENKFVHRDLAARNCLVAEDMTVKIGDFGLTRDIYETDYYRKGGKSLLPVRWMSPESLRDGTFTLMSDVWSYGVVMWEMATLAAQPYQGMSNEQVVDFICAQNTMDIPDNCPSQIEYLICLCWQKEKERPTFRQIVGYLLPHLNAQFEKVSYYFKSGGGHTGDYGGLPEDDYDYSSDSSGAPNYEGTRALHRSFSDVSDMGDDEHPSSQTNEGSTSFCENNIDPEKCVNEIDKDGHFYSHRRDTRIEECLGDSNDYIINGDCGVDLDDSSQPFISGDYQASPLVKSLQSHQNRNDSTQPNSELVELQPLINKISGSSSSRPTYVQSSDPYSSEHTSHHLPSVTTYDLSRMPSGPQTLHLQHNTAPDSLASGPGSSSTHLGQQTRLPSTKQAPYSLITQPTLRLPTLNQPPSVGFRRVPAYKQGDKVSYSGSSSSHRNDQPSDWDHYHHNQPSTSNVSVENSEEDSSPASPDQQSFPSHSAITSSSDDSKESSKSSGSHSHINGLTNGHIPVMKHRTAPC